MLPIYKLIKIKRREKGLTQSQLATLAGTTQAKISQIETGANTSFHLLQKVLKVLNIKIEIV